MTITWNVKQERHIEQALAALLAAWDGKAFQFSTSYEFAIQSLMTVLDPSLSRRRQWWCISRAVSDMAKSGGRDTDAFKRALSASLRQDANLTRSGPSLGCAFIPLHIPFPLPHPLATHARVLGIDFYLMRIDDWCEYFSVLLGAEDAGARRDLSGLQGTVAAIATPPERDTERSLARICSSFDALRGCIELLANHGVWRVGSERSPRCAVPPSPVAVFLTENATIEVVHFRGIHDLAPKVRLEGDSPRSRMVWLQFDNLTSAMGTGVESEAAIESMFADVLRLYAQAMDGRTHAACFLNLWQIAEAITLSENDRGSADRVIARLATLRGDELDKLNLCVEAVLMRIMQTRHVLVHRGLWYEVEEEDVNVLKTLVENAIHWLFAMRSTLPTRHHLAEWWSLHSKPATDLQRLAQVLVAVSEKRELG